jgi:hypothetical protein
MGLYGLEQGYLYFLLYLFNIFIDDNINYIIKDNPYTPVIVTTKIPGLLFADDLAFSSFTINGSQKATYQVTKCCREWNSECNLKKTKELVLVFKTGDKVKRDG